MIYPVEGKYSDDLTFMLVYISRWISLFLISYTCSYLIYIYFEEYSNLLLPEPAKGFFPIF